MIGCLAVAGYRSLRDLRLGLGQLNVVTGPNGSGKSSLYRALRLLADVAQGRIIQSLAAEGGLPSTLWAGPESFSRGMLQGTQPVRGVVRKQVVSLRLGFAGEDYGFAIDLGVPPPSPTLFSLDPQIKLESLWTGAKLTRASLFAERRGPGVRVRDAAGAWQPIHAALQPYDSMLMQCTDPREAAELLVLRERMRGWRFYDHLPTHPGAPARLRQAGTHTPVLATDGADLAAAMQTILEIGDADALAASVTDAFSGARLEVTAEAGVFELLMLQHGLLRSLRTAELSDGTLRYLMLIAALLTPRPPALMVLNEPETSLHPDLLPPLARLITQAATRSQVIVVTHAAALVAGLAAAGGERIMLEKRLGETLAGDDDPPPWTWPAR